MIILIEKTCHTEIRKKVVQVVFVIDDSATLNCLSFGQILLVNSAASNTTTVELSRSVNHEVSKIYCYRIFHGMQV